MADDADVIAHLLEVEREAAQMILAAQKEADAKVAEARAQAESQFKARYATLAAGIEAEETSERERIASSHKQSFEDYARSLESSRKDPEAFNALLDKLLYA
ncbi:MAG: hypothetical protein II187_10555 [Treponema sp.]|jgi:F0F1-type ATP synthase membrane subunit b/b'|nr:hypothetical protein [Treponema sp.]